MFRQPAGLTTIPGMAEVEASVANQAQAQAVLRANPNDPNRLDVDRAGTACERNRAPQDTVPVPP